MRSGTVVILLATALTVSSACASSGERTDREFHSRDMLTLDEIRSVRATNAYEVVERLKSHWLRIRGTTQLPGSDAIPQFRENPVLVYVDDQRLGRVEQLRQIEISAVQYIRYFEPAEASARWGFNHGGGVIFVSTRPFQS
ncbi:MAG: hypothetical protein ACOC5I_00980 [Gemmatimonadota bacterium]